MTSHLLNEIKKMSRGCNCPENGRNHYKHVCRKNILGVEMQSVHNYRTIRLSITVLTCEQIQPLLRTLWDLIIPINCDDYFFYKFHTCYFITI